MPAPIVVASVTSVGWDVLTGAWGAKLREEHIARKGVKKMKKAVLHSTDDNELFAAYLGVPVTRKRRRAVVVHAQAAKATVVDGVHVARAAKDAAALARNIMKA